MKTRKRAAPPGPAPARPRVSAQDGAACAAAAGGRGRGPTHRLVNDWEVVRMLSRAAFPLPSPADRRMDRLHRAADRRGTAYHLAITGIEAGREMLIGCIGLRLDDDAAHRPTWATGWAGASGAMASPPRRPAGCELGAGQPRIDRLEPRSRSTIAPPSPCCGASVSAKPARDRNISWRAAAPQTVLRFEATRDDLFGRPEAEPARRRIEAAAAGGRRGADRCRRRVLLARRPEGKKMAGLWEFPGGKLPPGETPEAALIRELREELASTSRPTAWPPSLSPAMPTRRSTS